MSLNIKKNRAYLRKMIQTVPEEIRMEFSIFYPSISKDLSILDRIKTEDIKMVCENVEIKIRDIYNKPLFEEVEL